MKQNYENVEWNGEKFVTKPMKLFRLNLNELKSSQVITSTSIQVQEFRQTYAKEVNTFGKWVDIGPHPPSVLESLRSRLADIDKKISNIQKRIIDLRSKHNKDLKELRNEVDQINQTVVPRIEETMADFEQEIAELKNETMPRLEDLFNNNNNNNNKDDKNKIDYGKANYCVMNNNEDHDCPDGFVNGSLNFYGSQREKVEFQMSSGDVANNLYMDYRNYKAFHYCCRKK